MKLVGGRKRTCSKVRRRVRTPSVVTRLSPVLTHLCLLSPRTGTTASLRASRAWTPRGTSTSTTTTTRWRWTRTVRRVHQSRRRRTATCCLWRRQRASLTCTAPTPFLSEWNSRSPSSPAALRHSSPTSSLPPPPDELEPPPKPPFADEAEEEEMLLRETCLMSMANKRVVVSEKSSSAPPSPGGPPPADLQPPPRGNLSTVSLNTVPQPRPNKAARAHLIARAPLVLPRHKAVVVSLNDSDDSDSDMDACSSSQAVFGGLEFMIKEARRTVEAAKPKGASASEKENNPVRTPEALPDAKKAEYRLLKEEIASRERQRMMKEQSPRGSASPATADSDSSLKPTAELKLSEAELKLTKHRELLQRDEAMLRHLLQQELKKNESLKAAEAKVAKLREQLQASERIVSANKMLLRKLREQVHRVEQRVSVKKTVAVRLEQELLQAHLAAGRAPKRRADSSRPTLSKLPRRDAAPRGSERHFAELIAQKQRLQQLESEYALKIQKLKEAQALRNKGIPPELPVEPPSRPATPPEPQVQLPQPSLHDLSQDKLTLDSEDAAEAEDHEPEPVPAAVARGSRRSSFRQSSCSFTKPHLDAASSAPPKDIGTAAKPVKALPSSSAGVELPVEMFAGLDVDALKRLYQQKTPLRELLLLELQVLGEDVDPAAQVFPAEVETAVSSSSSSELRPLPFRPYHSPLLVFRSYRFSPYYRTKEKLSLSSVTYSNAIEAKKCFCRFDLTGTCNDDGCRWQHMRNCTLSGNQLFQDILSYDLSLIGCSDSSSDEDVCAATEKYMKRLFGSNKDRMGVDQKAVLLVSKVNESKRHVPPYTTYKDARRWRPKPSTQSDLSPEDDGSDDEGMAADHMTPGRDGSAHIVLSTLDACVTSEDKRYFISETDDIANLEVSVLESPRDTQLWIKLAFKYLNQSEMRGSREEVQEMCEMAVEHAPDYRVWWNYLNLESSFEGKDYVCERLLQFLLAESSSGVMEKLSFQLMEALLYRVQLSLFTGRLESALAVLQNALKSPQDRSIADHLTAADRALLWLSYIHLTEFDRLPACLYDPAESGPSRVVSREPFLLPWRTPRDVRTPADILVAFFQDGVRQCSDEHASDSERTLACLPLHTNLIFLYKLLQRYSEGIALCESLLEFCPESCILRDALAGLHLHGGSGDRAVSMWLHALAECPHNAEVFYHCCKFLMAQEKAGAITPLFRGFVLSLCEDEQSPRTPVDVLRYILGFSSSSELLGGPVIKKELQERLRQQMSFLHLIHCRWQWLHGSVEDAAEAFERALGAVTQLEELHRLWMDYLMFSCSPQARAASQSRTFSDLVQRCLSTTPSRLELPFNPAEFWNCYRFHNKVVALYLSCLPPSQHALLLERLSYTMPNNTELGLRLLHQEWLDGNVEHLKFQARMLSGNVPKCLSSWKIAIAVEEELKERAERLLLEAAEGGASERLRRLWDCCQRAGVSVSGGVGPSLGEDG
uniref:Zinc finger C3H1-type containing n=1 Tax=Oreochromis niloticus TaxID=8128 RepID=I3KPG1_ORENI